MSKKSGQVFYRQCRYEQRYEDNNGKKWDVAWLPEARARVGNTIYFGKKRDNVERHEYYVVVEVGDTRRSAEWLNAKHNADKKQREASDI